jgi:hypothetical protein
VIDKNDRSQNVQSLFGNSAVSMQSSKQHPIFLSATDDALPAGDLKQDAGIPDLALLVAVSLMLMIVIGCSLWGLNRGFDILDEGFYMLMTSSPQEYACSSSFHFVLAKLPNIISSAVPNLRLVQVISQLVSSAVLVMGFWRLMVSKWFVPTKTQLCTSIVFTALGSFLFQAIFPPDMSYNGLTYFCIFSSFGLLFAGGSAAMSRRAESKYLTAAAGFLCGFVFFIKFSASIISLAMALLWLILNVKERRLWACYLIGLVISPIVFFCLFETPLQYKEQVLETIKLASVATPFSPTTLIHTYTEDFIATTSTIWQNLKFCFFSPVLGAILTISLIGRVKLSVGKWLSWTIAVLGMAPVFFLARLSDELLNGWYSIIYAALLLYLSVIGLFMMGGANGKIARPNRLAFTSIMLLFVLPFACSVGTSNPILLQVTTCLPPVFLALFALSLKTFPDFCSSAYRSVLIAGMSLLVFFLFIHGYLYHPYLLGDSLINQKCDAGNLRNLRGLKLGKEAHQFLTSTSTILEKGGFCPGDPILALYNMPGVVYAVGGTAPSVAWLFSTAGFENYRPVWFHDIRAKVQDKLFVLTSWEPALKTQKSLQKAGINFPNEFELIGTTQMKSYVDGYGFMNRGAGDHYLGGEVRVYKWKK